MEIVSIFKVKDFKTKATHQEAIHGCGQEAINFLRSEYPRYSRFILVGFEINGKKLRVNYR